MSGKGLYLPDGSYYEFSDSVNKADLSTEFATRLAAGSDVAGFLGWLPDPDPILRKRGDDAGVLEDLTADDQVCMAMQNRRLRVLNKQDYDFKPGLITGQDATNESKLLCENLTKDLEGINLRDVFSGILDTPFYGYTVLELLWEPDGGRMRLADIIAKPREWFAFNSKNQLVFRGENALQGEPLPEGKFVLVQHFPTFNNPYGLRLLSRCLWPVAFKRGGVSFLSRFLEKFGMPWILAKAPQSMKERSERMSMASDLASMVQDAVAVLPHGADVELASAQGKAGDTYERYLSRWDKSISKVLTGQTLAAEMDGQNGSRAASETHYSVAGDISDADQFMVVSAMNDISMTYRAVNAVPSVLAPVFGYNEPDDHDAQASLDKKLHSVGVRFKPSHFVRRYALNEDEFYLEGEEATEAEVDSNDHSDFSETTDHQDVIDDFVNEMLPEGFEASKHFASQIEKIVKQAESVEDLQLLLAEQLGTVLDEDDMSNLLSRCMENAELYGRHAAKQEGSDG